MAAPWKFNVKTTFEEGAPEIEVAVDRLKSGIHNINVNTISSQLRDQLMGKDAGQWDYEGEMKDITLDLPDVTLSQFDDITLRNRLMG